MRITNNLKLDDIISMDVLGEKVKFKVVGTIYTYNYKEIFADEKKLSAQLLGQSDLINTVYVKDDDKYIYEEIEDNKISYTSIERDTLIDEYKDGILNGTEMVETFLYVYLAVSVFLIINMLLMSLEEKRRYNYVFEKLGLRKSKIVVMNVMETIVIALIGMTLGLIFGTLLNSGLPKTVEIMYGVRMKIFLPLGLLTSIGVFTELVILLAAFAISVFSTNSKNLRLSGGEE
ncbi:MAG: FtsX-like permease family protein [Clostridium sp.]|nr:FtsX-like permease family protein [Clostridium sp.]